MKKIGVITLSNSTNYGGILQAVALSATLRKFGMDPVNITYQKMETAWKSPCKYVRNRVRLYGNKGLKTKIRICAGVLKTILSNIYYFSSKKKIENFRGFIEKNLNTTPYYESNAQLKKNCSSFDAYITGSDQVWNNTFTENKFQDAYFLEFVPDDIPCYSYAASVGGQKDDKYVAEIVWRTKHFSGITVRESSLEQHMKIMGCKKVDTVLDPTLLLTKEEWLKFEKKPEKKIPEHYILVYFLERSAANDPIVIKISNEFELPVVNIMPDRHKAKYQQIIDSTAGPAEFLYYVNHADYVITNSFHMVVFSLLFRKKFIALKRTGQESRINDLLLLVKMSNRLIENNVDYSVIKEDLCELGMSFQIMLDKSEEYLKQIGEV